MGNDPGAGNRRERYLTMRRMGSFFRYGSFWLILLWVGTAIAAEERYLGEIRLTDLKGGFQVEILGSGPIKEYDTFSLAAPDRFVVDLKGRWRHIGKSVYLLENHLIRQIVVGIHPDKARIVLHLKRSVPEPQIRGEKNGLYLRYPVPGPPKAALPPAVVENEGGKVERIWLMEDGSGFRMFIETDTSISKLQSYFTADEPSGRVVMEILGKWRYDGKRILLSPGKMVDKVKVGRHEGFLRIEVDFAVNADYFSPIVRKTSDGALLEVKWPTRY